MPAEFVADDASGFVFVLCVFDYGFAFGAVGFDAFGVGGVFDGFVGRDFGFGCVDNSVKFLPAAPVECAALAHVQHPTSFTQRLQDAGFSVVQKVR